MNWKQIVRLYITREMPVENSTTKKLDVFHLWLQFSHLTPSYATITRFRHRKISRVYDFLNLHTVNLRIYEQQLDITGEISNYR